MTTNNGTNGSNGTNRLGVLDRAERAFETGDYDRAVILYRKGARMLEGILGPSHMDLAICLLGLAHALEASRRPAEACDARERAQTIMQDMRLSS